MVKKKLDFPADTPRVRQLSSNLSLCVHLLLVSALHSLVPSRIAPSLSGAPYDYFISLRGTPFSDKIRRLRHKSNFILSFDQIIHAQNSLLKNLGLRMEKILTQGSPEWTRCRSEWSTSLLASLHTNRACCGSPSTDLGLVFILRARGDTHQTMEEYVSVRMTR